MIPIFNKKIEEQAGFLQFMACVKHGKVPQIVISTPILVIK